MSKLSRSIERVKRDLDGSVKWYNSIIDNIWFYLDHCALSTFYYSCKGFARNVLTFCKLAWVWRPWDSHYTIEALIVLLKKQAQHIKENDNHVGAQRTARRCYTAAGMLDKAYNRDIDKTIHYLLDKNPWNTGKAKSGMYTMETTYVTDKKTYDCMYKIARERSDREEKAAKKEAWEYLHKYIEHFWD